ncbi:MAG: peptidylprolyl isomerase [Clostridiales Family XIII bacterium]|jgi:peptidyl-prolyl cis-trans isomerase B (cyclophilin B)|nr:peptidylprolyl isomerase [Clostridiales Family XIII bacterium]
MLFLSALIPAAFICVASFSGCSSKNDDASSGGDAGDSDVSSSAQEGTETPKVEITMEDGGTITLELDRDNAPKTVENFLKLINDKFYDGLTFHRIIPNFMIQGGDPEGTGMGGSDEEIVGEFSSNGFSNSLSHTRGVISMARSQNMDSASSQFFITNADAPNLDGDYAAFGRVTDGMDVVDKISAVKTGANDRPVEPVVIKSIRVID